MALVDGTYAMKALRKHARHILYGKAIPCSRPGMLSRDFLQNGYLAQPSNGKSIRKACNYREISVNGYCGKTTIRIIPLARTCADFALKPVQVSLSTLRAIPQPVKKRMFSFNNGL